MGARPPMVHASLIADGHLLCLGIRTKGLYGYAMATWSDVRRIAGELPEVDEQTMADGSSRWRVRRTLFVWERPLRRGDLEALGKAAPKDAPLAARVADVGVRAAMIAEDPDLFFTIPHFDGYPAVLARLDRLSAADLEELVVEAWLLRAPAKLGLGRLIKV